MELPAAPTQAPLLGALLRTPAEAVHRRMLDDLHRAGHTDLVAAHLVVLRYPSPHGQRPSDLAAGASMTKQAMNYLLGQLEELGYLRREDDPDDGRSRRVALTERGWAAYRCMRDTVGRIEQEVAEQMGAAEFARLRELLVKLNTCTIAHDRQASPG